MVLLRCLLVPKIMHRGGTGGLPPSVKAQWKLPYELNSVMQIKTQQNKKASVSEPLTFNVSQLSS